MGKINIVLAKSHQKQAEDPNVKREHEDIQAFFDENRFTFKEDTVNFVIIRGIYENIERKMTIVGVFVNKTNQPVYGLKGLLEFNLREKRKSVRFAEMSMELSTSFLGEIKADEGFILHIKVPVEGLGSNKQIYEATALTGHLKDVELLFAKE